MNEIQKFIFDHRLKPCTQILLDRKDSIVFLELLKKNNKRLSGFDGFHFRKDMSPSAVQIDQAFSPDYSGETFASAYQKASEFFAAYTQEDMGYQFVYDDANNDYKLVKEAISK